ncbi:IS607 family transposase [Nostoc sp. CHAB 5714]|uniref:IS607 family transposase n=1 Tax=Nostoc favosum CHAB5714 TaxID=2780399 RepID=A0ABS8I8N9_9NOSO|nr:IS607 family transposase [Nostoc favosum]MCC5600163.1 IS607 family transposase [Nostoc favosum CHAB5714]
MSDYAKTLGISYLTAWRHYKAGKIPYPTEQLPTGTVIVDYDPKKISRGVVKVAIYARVSSAENKDNLDRQAERLSQYAIAKGYQIAYVIKEVGSGLNDNRKKLEKLFLKDDYDILLVEHKDRLGRFGTHYIDILLKRLGVNLEVVNLADNGETALKTGFPSQGTANPEGRDELMQDLVAIITSFAARLYGQRRAKRKIDLIVETLNSKTD